MATAAEQVRTETLVTGADAVVESLLRHGVEVLFAYPGGCSMPLHQSLTRYGDRIRTILPRHEQGGAFAAQGYARTTGRPGVCMATSGPGALNLVTAIADAKLDSIPLIALTGQVPTAVIGTDAFQETPIVEVCRGITKHHFLVTRAEDIPRIVKEAFHIATTGRPGPVLIDLPKDVQQTHIVPDYDVAMNLPGYHPEVRHAHPEQIAQVANAIRRAKRPVIYAGGGVITGNASENLRILARKTGIPVTMTLMGLGAFPGDDPLSLDMLGMHGSVYANYAIDEADLLIAVGVRFDDRVTGKVSEFARHGFIVHIDIDPSEINKNKPVHVPIVADVNEALGQLNEVVEPPEASLADWHARIAGWKQEDPFAYDTSYPGILPQEAIAELSKLAANRDTVVTVGVGQHQMWAAQFVSYERPKTWINSGGLGTMGFAVPAAMGAKMGRPEAEVWAIDGDGCFQMTNQELATCAIEGIPIKVAVINNGNLGMVRQWQTLFYEERYSQTDLATHSRRIPDFVKLAEALGCVGLRCEREEDVAEVIAQARAIDDRPVVIDFIVGADAQVWPMVAAGTSNDEIMAARGIRPLFDDPEEGHA